MVPRHNLEDLLFSVLVFLSINFFIQGLARHRVSNEWLLKPDNQIKSTPFYKTDGIYWSYDCKVLAWQSVYLSSSCSLASLVLYTSSLSCILRCLLRPWPTPTTAWLWSTAEARRLLQISVISKIKNEPIAKSKLYEKNAFTFCFIYPRTSFIYESLPLFCA